MHTKEQIYRPGTLEKWGRRVILSLSQKRKKGNREENSDGFEKNTNRTILLGTIYSFFIGFIPSYAFVYLSFFLPTPDIYHLTESFESIVYILLLIILFTAVEFYLLFRVCLYLSFRMAEYADIELEDEPELITPIPGMLARIALEIPDPELKLYGIDPYRRLNRKALALKSILYKIKVLLSNLIAKVLLKAVIGRSSLRLYIEYVAAPITGFWDAFTTYQILKELRMRIITRKISEQIIHLAKQKADTLSVSGKLACLQAVANSIVYTKTFHPNFEYLLLKLVQCFSLETKPEEIDDFFKFKLTLGSCGREERKFAFHIFLIGVAFDGNPSEEEKEILPDLYPEFSESQWQEVKELSSLIRKGHLKEAVLKSEKMMF
ncbi:LBF_2804 family protein [Leptospira idonii]|uniref:Uncharacterized protein n=1 Tax=Leptospira idonii TaxID=1193500 RepID=A0A4R9LXC8_9LEPT|nr:hypothetical protein [Leptospira idonii]TGN18920.1 hypothetical protein EHS15_10905 [Leptospira idonii]